MIANARFLSQPRDFWAHVRTISQVIGYTLRRDRQIKTPTLEELCSALSRLGLSSGHLRASSGPTAFGTLLVEYFEHRAKVINEFVEPRLMNADAAQELFGSLRASLNPHCPVPMNKQKSDKKAPAFFTGIVNMLIESNSRGFACDYDPRTLTTFTRNAMPMRTLARRIDGAFPSAVNPVAIWEIKEYYYTTTFGSRVADGIYETLLDGMELEELRASKSIQVMHYLMIDSHYTWWVCGRSYLCRVVDLLHMGYVDEVLFGREVVERLPTIVSEWVQLLSARANRT